MGMLGNAFLSGLAQGGNVLASGMMYDARAQQDEGLYEKRAQVLADIQRASASQQRTDARDFSVDPATLEASRKVLANASQGQQEAELGMLGNDALQGARRRVKADDAVAQHDAEVNQRIADSKNPSLLQAMADLENADPAKKAEVGLKNAQAGYYRAHGQAVLATANAKGGGAEKMVEYQSLFGQVKAAMANQEKFESDAAAQLTDGNGTPTQQYAIVKSNVAKAQRALLSFQMKQGIIDPTEAAAGVLRGESSLSNVGAAIKQAYALGGEKYGSAFEDAIRSSDAFEALKNDAVAAATAAQTKAAQTKAASVKQKAKSESVPFSGPLAGDDVISKSLPRIGAETTYRYKGKTYATLEEAQKARGY
jgi:hypothetical protein